MGILFSENEQNREHFQTNQLIIYIYIYIYIYINGTKHDNLISVIIQLPENYKAFTFKYSLKTNFNTILNHRSNVSIH